MINIVISNKQYRSVTKGRSCNNVKMFESLYIKFGSNTINLKLETVDIDNIYDNLLY